jgi:uncharacterized MAPEG superfamily protein
MTSVAVNCFPAAVALWLAPAPARLYVKARLSSTGIRGLVNANRNLRALPVPPEAQDLVTRLEMVHGNAGESLPIFFAAILAGIACGVPAAAVDAVAVQYLRLRVGYAAVALASTPKRPWLGLVRTGIWFYSTGALLQLMLKAAATLKPKPK